MFREYESSNAVSVTTGFILNVGIATLAVSLIMFSLQGMFTDLQEESAESEIRVVGENLAWELEKAERMAENEAEGELQYQSPRLGMYEIRVHESYLHLRKSNADVIVNHTVSNWEDPNSVPYNTSGGQNHIIEYDSGGVEIR